MEKLAGRPFALIGVDSLEHTPEELLGVMEKENLTWRSFADSGEIVRQWNLSGTPTYYVLDALGVIRCKWVGNPAEGALDAALERLIREAEEARAAPR